MLCFTKNFIRQVGCFLMRLAGLIVLLCCASSSVAHALTLGEVESNLSSFELLKSNFQQTRYVSGLSAPLESSGHLFLSRDDGLAWIQVKPFGISFIFTEDLFVENSPGQLKKVSKRSDKPQIFKLIALFETFFSGNYQILSDFFDLEFSFEGGQLWQLILIPKDTRLKKIIKEIHVQGSQLINQVTLYENSGNRAVIRFYDTVTDSKLLNDEKKYYFQD